MMGVSPTTVPMQRQIEVKVLEIVMPDTAQADDRRARWVQHGRVKLGRWAEMSNARQAPSEVQLLPLVNLTASMGSERWWLIAGTGFGCASNTKNGWGWIFPNDSGKVLSKCGGQKSLDEKNPW